MSRLSRFIIYAQDYKAEHPREREGQAAFNALQEFDASLASGIEGTYCDPLHHDERLSDFWCYVLEAYDSDAGIALDFPEHQ